MGLIANLLELPRTIEVFDGLKIPNLFEVLLISLFFGFSRMLPSCNALENTGLKADKITRDGLELPLRSLTMSSPETSKQV